ncbi:MAG: histidinol-phosphate transaminase [Actinomycetota bacterium]|nr:histidinol-phosphate transaminase [Actinomycetota bacterium]
MTSTPRLRPALDGIPAYKAGQPARAGTGTTSFKLSSNENHHDPLPSVLAAAERALRDMHRYPDYGSTALIDALADRLQVPADHLSVGTGSVGMLQQLVQITAGPGDGVVYAWRSFEAYPIMTQIAGATSQPIPLDAEDRHDLPAMLAAIDDTTRLVMVCNPNNPTSTAVGRDALASFLAQVPRDVLVVLDEAYTEFVDPARIPDGLDFYREYPNVAVLRTFSKAYGLAGLRVGYCVAHGPVTEALRKVQVPFGVSTVAQVAAIASLAAEEELFARVSTIVAERDRVVAELGSRGLALADSEANFVWLRLGERTADFAARCDEAGLAVRPVPGEGVRITIGEAQANDRLLAFATQWASQHPDQQ